MDALVEYYVNKYEEITELSNTTKCRTCLVKNTDTNEILVKKQMDVNAYEIYNKLKVIENKNLVNVLECFIIDGKCVAYEEYISGRRLSDIVRESTLTPNQIANYGMQLCNALEDVHSRGIVHRDIQPKNIIVTSEGLVKLIDFDIARQIKVDAHKDTVFLGTIGYASPEQYGFAQTNERSDIYSLGAVLRKMSTGKEDGSLELCENSQLRNIINKCMEMDEKNRFESVLQLRIMLEKCSGNYKKDSETKEATAEKEQLPPITLKYILRTIPGFRKGNIFVEIYAALIYVLMLWLFGFVGLSLDASTYVKVFSFIMYESILIVPYIFLTNIANVMDRLFKKKYESKSIKIGYQIAMALWIFIVFFIIIAITLPIEKANP